MANLAIKGHPTRGKEVIEILEMLGGKNVVNHDGSYNRGFYFLDTTNIICHGYGTGKLVGMDSYTLEEFLEKYPYKVGDKVCYQPNLQIDTICISEIISMKWADNSVIYFTSNGHSLHACDLQPYKEEIVEEEEENFVECIEKTIQECLYGKEESMEGKETFKPSEGPLVQIDFTRELRIADEVEVILGDYEFVLKNGKTYFVKKKPQYPKTYKECCEVLNLGEDGKLWTKGYKASLIQDFQKLLICRNAYWKIAGEELGLGKPWKPDWEDDSEIYYTISYKGINIKCYNNTDVYSKLAFSTEEMRDAFYENFKELIDKCKELL